MGAVAKWLIGGVSEAASGNRGAARQAKRAPFRVDDLEIAFDAKGAIVVHGYLGCRHFSLLDSDVLWRLKPLGRAKARPYNSILSTLAPRDRPRLTTPG